MKRYSYKREAIYNCIKESKEHPSAEWVYQKLKPVIPNLSLATVYRNMAEMKKDGLIRSVGTVQDKERFDGDVRPHVHALCSVCGKVMDIDGVPIPEELLEKAQKDTGFSVAYSNLQLFGICKDCRDKENIK